MACDGAGTPCGGAAAPPPPGAGVGEQCPQGTMLAGRANQGHCGAGVVQGRRNCPHRMWHPPPSRPQSASFTMRPQSQALYERNGVDMAAYEGLRLAVQRQGRLTEGTLALLHAIGLEFESYNQRLFSPCRNFPLALLYARDDDIPEYVAAGTVDAGIVGQNLIHEESPDVAELLPLGYGYCTLVLAVPKKSRVQGPC